LLDRRLATSMGERFIARGASPQRLPYRLCKSQIPAIGQTLNNRSPLLLR
jgi:hypothetical protein